MLKNILKITFRNFIKERFYALINIFGLAMGIATSLLIVSYVMHETSYDQTHPNGDRLYRVNMTHIWMPQGGQWGSTVPPLANVLATEYPEIEAVLRINTPGSNIIRATKENNNEWVSFYEDDILAADSNFFSFFDFELIYGNPETALNGVDQVVISREMAIKYFGTDNVLGKTLLLGENKKPLEITGITATQPTNRHFDFDFLISMPTNPAVRQMEQNWIWTQVVTYVRLRPQIDIASLEQKLAAIAPKHVAPLMTKFGMDYDKFMEGKGDWKFYLQPVTDIHLHSSQIGNRLGDVSDGTYMYIFSFTAFFVLLLAVINFVNLSTARASIRAKEVGVRKVLGSTARHLIFQFLTESVVMCVIAGLLALGLSEFMRILISQYLGSSFLIAEWYSPVLYVYLFCLVVFIGILAGGYPALYLTAFKPSKVLKGEFRTGEKSKWFRNGLVVVQFSISTALMVCTFIVYEQLNFFTSKDLGYDKENILVINWADKLGNQLESFRDEVVSNPDVVSASVSMDVIGRGSYEDVFRDESSGHEQPIAMMKADEHQLETMGLQLVHGRFFEENNPADKESIVINESTMELFGYTPENVLGQRIIYGGDDIGPVRVIGVVKDFHFYSLHYPIAPYIFYHVDASLWGSSRVLTIKTKSTDPRPLIDFLKKEWDARADAPFDYSFLDLEYASQYRSEQQLGALFAIFTAIAMTIACLGLFGLASYTVGQKSKEIGIRKTLGATVSQIMFQFSGKFTRLILISLFIGIPVAYYTMHQWLEQFVFRVDMKWQIFAITGCVAVLIGMITVSYQAIKAARLNPTETLKDE
ncbi:MAG: ABC transporter permease [Fulvivirga sp.]|nr:ABC transporter permease [Fulvivirga sp.]